MKCIPLWLFKEHEFFTETYAADHAIESLKPDGQAVAPSYLQEPVDLVDYTVGYDDNAYSGEPYYTVHLENEPIG